jgi:ATP-dependent DNA helicase DinG
LAQAQVIVVNHDLLLSTLGLRALPAPDDCYVIFDEAHHLSSVAQGQFTSAMDWMRTQWLDRLPRAVEDVAAGIQYTVGVDVTQLSKSIKSAQGELARMGMMRIAQQPAWTALVSRTPRSGERREGNDHPPPVIDRLDQGALPSEWVPWIESLQNDASALLKVFEGMATQLKAQARDNPGDAPRLAQLYSRLGVLAPRLQSVEETARRWLEAPVGQQPPLAKWLEAQVHNGLVTLSAHACPVQPGQLLRHHLWQRVRAAVVTSASLTTCGTFDHFLRESGLYGDPAVHTREVKSPFNHAEQGRLVVVQTQADPKDVEAYTHEMLATLMVDLQQVERGALVLFTSRAQMKQALLALEQGANRDLRERVLVQGDASRTVLLQRHGDRVESGLPSILFGLQSFGEGLDLPGELCEWVFITKLPFASPSDPVGQARADWVKAQGRDPFSELVVPATGARLLQWTGRALRTENDQAVVVCYDPRLLRQAYGRRMLQGLPPYRLQRRVNGQDVDVNP